MIRITGTFLDEISHDIPHQNWGPEEWERDFAAMKAMGIGRVILIRAGWGRWMTYPSEILQRRGGFAPPLDLMRLFLDLAGRYGMEFYCGTYDSNHYHWNDGFDAEGEARLMREVCDEIWTRYGDAPAFAGWYLSSEIAGRVPGVTAGYRALGRHLKAATTATNILISPGIRGRKAYDKDMNKVANPITPEEHEREWDAVLAEIAGLVDIVAFQDGHVDFDELPEFLAINRRLCAKHGIACWTNTESFDRDMPIDFLPIKFEKLLLKLRAAEQAGVTDAITFEFSHFMSPHSCYPQAHGLYRRYREHVLGDG